MRVSALHTTESGRDEVYFKITADDQATVTSPQQSIQDVEGIAEWASDHSPTSIGGPTCTFRKSCKIEVMESDSSSGDDLIGTAYLNSAQRGMVRYRLNDTNADYILAIEVDVSPQPIGRLMLTQSELNDLRPGKDFGDLTIFNFDTRRASTVYALGVTQNLTRVEKVRKPSSTVTASTLDIPYMEMAKWSSRTSGDFSIPGLVYIFDSAVHRDAAKQDIEEYERTKQALSLALEVGAAFASLGPPGIPQVLAGAAQLTFSLTNDILTTEMTKRLTKAAKFPGLIAVTNPSNEFLMVSRAFPDYSPAGSLQLAVATLNRLDGYFTPPDFLCSMLKHPLEVACTVDPTK